MAEEKRAGLRELVQKFAPWLAAAGDVAAAFGAVEAAEALRKRAAKRLGEMAEQPKASILAGLFVEMPEEETKHIFELLRKAERGEKIDGHGWTKNDIVHLLCQWILDPEPPAKKRDKKGKPSKSVQGDPYAGVKKRLGAFNKLLGGSSEERARAFQVLYTMHPDGLEQYAASFARRLRPILIGSPETIAELRKRAEECRARLDREDQGRGNL